VASLQTLPWRSRLTGSTVCYALDARFIVAQAARRGDRGPTTAGNPGNVGLKRYAGEFDNGRNAVRHTKLLLLAMVAAAGPSLTSAQELRPVANPEQLGFSSARLQRLTETYQGYVDLGELPGAVLLIARGEKIAYLQAVGYQDREKKTPMKVDAIFRLASMTKPIVSVSKAACATAPPGRALRAAEISASVIGLPEARAFAAPSAAATPVPTPGMKGATISASFSWSRRAST
jgi:hypothetical protein